MTVLGVKVGQIDDLVVTLNGVLPNGIRLRFEVEHELVPATLHRTLEDAVREQCIEERFAAEEREAQERDRVIEARLSQTFGKGAAA